MSRGDSIVLVKYECVLVGRILRGAVTDDGAGRMSNSSFREKNGKLGVGSTNTIEQERPR